LKSTGCTPRRIGYSLEQPDEAPPPSDEPPTLDNVDRKVVEKLDRILDVAELELAESRKSRAQLPVIRRKLDQILERIERSPNPILGAAPPPKAPQRKRRTR
jgi:hypothetical protein